VISANPVSRSPQPWSHFDPLVAAQSSNTQRPQPVRIPSIPTITSASEARPCEIKTLTPRTRRSKTTSQSANWTLPPHRLLRTTHHTHQQPQIWERFTDPLLVPERSSLKVSLGSCGMVEERLLTMHSPQGKLIPFDTYTPPRQTATHRATIARQLRRRMESIWMMDSRLTHDTG
jgi:hypothetical protein